MTLQELNNICNKNNIPDDVKLLSDSGWECYETEMDGVYYSKKDNTIIFTQKEDCRYTNPGYKDLIRLK